MADDTNNWTDTDDNTFVNTADDIYVSDSIVIAEGTESYTGRRSGASVRRRRRGSW